MDGGGAAADPAAADSGAVVAAGCGAITANGGSGNNAGTASGGSGIGGGNDGDGGTTTLNGGATTATGGRYSAGIGGGYQGAGGTVAIYGGTITATGGSFAAGIGDGALVGGNGGTLAIHGEPDVGAATDGGAGDPLGGNAPTITNPTQPAGVSYSAVTSTVGGGGQIVVVFRYLVTFDSAGGTTTEEQTVNEDGTVTEPADPTRSGYQFAGWQLDTQPYDFTSKVTAPIALTAAWTPALAATGADPGLFFSIALALLLLGGTLLTARRPRRA